MLVNVFNCLKLFMWKSIGNNLCLFSLLLRLLKILRACLSYCVVHHFLFFFFCWSNKDYGFTYWIRFDSFVEITSARCQFLFLFFKRAWDLGRLCHRFGHGHPESRPNRITINFPVNLWRSKDLVVSFVRTAQ